MNSKEALREIITNTLKYLPSEIINKNSELSNIVLKDLDRLEKLEDLEKELGYDLILAKNLIDKNVWVKVQESIIERPVWFVDLSGRLVVGNAWSFNDKYRLKDYGKTWALTRKVLEHDK